MAEESKYQSLIFETMAVPLIFDMSHDVTILLKRITFENAITPSSVISLFPAIMIRWYYSSCFFSQILMSISVRLVFAMSPLFGVSQDVRID